MTTTALPIAALREEITEAVATHPVVILTAETGAGKSTQVAQYLLQADYDIVVTQPRRLATRTVATRVAEEFGTPLGEVVGFRTAYERQDSEATRCLFVTDGLALVRELMGAGTHQVLVLDEVHEWNLNIEVLIAWARSQIEAGVNFKVVLMSATLEAERLAHYFGGAPIITVPGRTYPVTDQPPAGPRLEDDVVTLLQQGRNVLVFQPGKAEIGQTVNHLRAVEGLNAEILPLHGELTYEEQERCFRAYPRAKCVVATNVAQTSITILDIDAVVDSGLERRIELVEGVEGLYLKAISHADSAQRKGRAGRTKPGIYVDWCPTAWDDRLAFPKAEVLRTRLDQTVLRLAEAGFDMEGLQFFHQPDLGKIHDAKGALHSLGCIDTADRVTRIGHLVAKLPVSVQYARMIVEADRLGVVDDVITIAAILEQGEINARVCALCRQYNEKSCRCWLQLTPGETTSDVLAQLAVYRAAEKMQRSDMPRKGVFAKAFYQAKEKRHHLTDALRGKVTFGSNGKREGILRAICAGMVEYLYLNSYGSYRGSDGTFRQLARESVAGGSRWIVGKPWDLQIQTRNGPTVLPLINMASKVDASWLVEVAPQLVKIKTGLKPRFDPDQQEVVSTTETWFNGQVIESCEVLDPAHVEAARLRREGRNDQQWQVWSDKPQISLPDPANVSAIIPDIVVCAYGTDAETGEPLTAYGTVALNRNRWYLSDPYFTVRWTRDRSEADHWRQEVASRLALIQAEAKRERQAAEAEQLKQTAQPLAQQISTLYRQHYSNDELSVVLRRRLYDYSHVPYTSNPEVIRQWLAEAEVLVTEVTADLAATEAHKAEAAVALAPLVETAKSLRDEANGLLVDYTNELTDTLYEELRRLDVDDSELPTIRVGLEDWISTARACIAAVRRLLPGGVSNDSIAALAARFNGK